MIVISTRTSLIRRRDELYEQIHSVVGYASVQHVEAIMRRINIINLKLLSYKYAQKNTTKEEDTSTY